MHGVVEGQRDGGCCLESGMSGTVMEDKSLNGGTDIGIEMDFCLVERDGKTDSLKTT